MIQKNIDLCTYDYQPYNGYYEVPDRPGIGQEVTEDTIRRSEVILIK
jgi:galactonate dehydratase